MLMHFFPNANKEPQDFGAKGKDDLCFNVDIRDITKFNLLPKVIFLVRTPITSYFTVE